MVGKRPDKREGAIAQGALGGRPNGPRLSARKRERNRTQALAERRAVAGGRSGSGRSGSRGRLRACGRLRARCLRARCLRARCAVFRPGAARPAVRADAAGRRTRDPAGRPRGDRGLGAVLGRASFTDATSGGGDRGGCHVGVTSSLRAARRCADLDLGFAATSPGVGATARRVNSSASGSCPHTQIGSSGGQMHPRARSARKRFTRRSSSEWNEIAASRPPGRSSCQAAGSAASSWTSSSLTAMRSAWKVRRAGWPPANCAGTGTAL